MEAYRFDEGMITVACCNSDLSIGTLTLRGNESLERHSRPVDEELLQVRGTGALRLFDDNGDEERTVSLEEGDTFLIPADKQHQHLNPTGEESAVLWKFEGDIRDVIEDIRESCTQVA